MRKTFRRRRTRRRTFNKYEMQQGSFTRETVRLVGGSTEANPAIDAFLMYHPRFEYSNGTGGTVDRLPIPPIERGCVVSGIHHRLIFSFTPPFSDQATFTAVGFATIHSAIVRLPTDEAMTPLLLPNLFLQDVDVTPTPAGGPNTQFRILWRQLTHLRVVDGVVEDFNMALYPASTAGYAGGTTREMVRTRSKARLSTEQGLFLITNTISPFTTPDLSLGMDFWYAGGIKRITSGPNTYL